MFKSQEQRLYHDEHVSAESIFPVILMIWVCLKMGYIMVYPSSVFLKRGDMMIDKSGIRYALFSEKKTAYVYIYIYV